MSEKITFKQLVEQISRESDQSQNSTNSFIHELVGIIESGLRDQGSVSISGFGKFELRWMNERRGRNPQTGEEMTIPGQNKVVFKPYKALREDVNRPYARMKAQILGSQAEETDSPLEPESESHAEPQEEQDSLLIERDPPRPAPKADQEEETVPEEFRENLMPASEPFGESESEIDSELIFEEELPNEAELSREVEKSGTMIWAYAASTVIVAIAIIAMMYLMQQQKQDSPQLAGFTSSPVQEPIETVVNSSETELESVSLNETEQETPSDAEKSFEVYTVQPGETLWSIAERSLGDPYLWPWIYQLNNSQLEDPNKLLRDTELTIPSHSVSESLTSDQKDQIASGYLSVYDWSQQHQPENAKFFLWAVGEFSQDVLAQASQNVDSEDLAFAINR